MKSSEFSSNFDSRNFISFTFYSSKQSYLPFLEWNMRQKRFYAQDIMAAKGIIIKTNNILIL